ncbi:MAG TPA: glycosyltransferase [Terracidiphilus sp.]|nr:glycosyltransferase [Terracidiphilus sp.]
MDFEQAHVGPYRSAGALGIAQNSQAAFLLSLAAGRSYSIDKYAHRRAKRAFRRIMEHGNFDVIWYEKLQAAGVGLRSGLLGKRPGPIHVLRSHNIEYSMFAERFEMSGQLSRWLLGREEQALKVDELEVVSRIDMVLNVTPEDMEQYRSERPVAAGKLLVVPMFPEEEGPYVYKQVSGRKFALFVGDCRWRPNLLAAEWIVNQLAPELLRVCPPAVIRLAGRGTEAFKHRASNVEAMGFVDDIGAEYDQAVCTVAPIWHGGGVNIKVIASLAQGVPVVGSQFARRGTLTDSYLEAETPTQFASHVDQLFKNPQKAQALGRSAQESMEELEKQFHEFWHRHFD